MLKRSSLAVMLVLCGACSSSSEKCTDGVDNDDNGLADCQDPHCGLGAACNAAGMSCNAQQECAECSGNGGTPEARETRCGDGLDNDCDGKIDCADTDCQPSASGPGGLCDASGQTCSAPSSTGESTCGASAGGLRFLGADYYVLGAFGSGYQEEATLTFQVIADDGRPYAAGLPVTFAHAPQGGSFIGSTGNCTPTECVAEGITRDDGTVSVVLTSGRRFASLSVRATTTVGGVPRVVTAGNFTVVGAKPNGAHLSLDCEFHNVPALTHADCLYSNYCWGRLANGADPCTVKMADRHGIAIGVPTHVAFQAEAGAVPPATVSAAYDASTSASGQTALGHADAYYEFCNSPLPFDVEPLTGELSAQADWGCGTRTANPRDGLSTMIAMVAGEEGFVDTNLNGVYDRGEPFVDLGEPFVDVDDDGVRSPGEWFLDVDDDGAWDAPNGAWDADTILWTQTRLLYTGYPARLASGGNEQVSRFFALPGTQTAPAAPTPLASPFTVHAGPPPTSVSYGLFLADQNLNPLTSWAGYSVSATSTVSVELAGPYGTADSIGASFRQLYCDHPTLPATCEDGPAAQACKTSPCYVVWDVGGCNPGPCRFQYGNRGVVTITGANPGSATVYAEAEIDGVVASLTLDGVCVP